MLVFILSCVGVAVSCVVLGSIIGPKLRYLSSLNISELHTERELKIKNKIIKDRIKRRIQEGGKYFFLILEPIGVFLKNIGAWFGKFYQYLLEVREKHRRSMVVGGATISSVQETGDEKIKNLLQEARGYLFDERYSEAEQKFIEIVTLDKKRTESYKGLAEVYRLQHDWEHAREVLEYLVKLESEKLKSTHLNDTHDTIASCAQTFFLLSDVYQKCDQNEQALMMLKKASELESTNPKFLDALVECYMVLNQRLKAEQALEQLMQANPENNKINEFKERLKELSY